MEVSGQLHALAALPPRKETGWAPEPDWMLWRREKSVVWEPNLSYPAHSLSLNQLNYPGSYTKPSDNLQPNTIKVTS
jgi:hypothetical protein